MNETIDPQAVSAFVLGMKRNYRGRDLEVQLENLNVRFKNIWGLDISSYPVHYLDSLVDISKSRYILGRKMTHSEVSCSLGHLEMYEEFLMTNSYWGLFLEDDARIHLDLGEILKVLPLDRPPTILSLSSFASERFEPQPFPFLPETLKVNDLIEFRRCAKAPVGAFGYLMNRGGALKAVHEMRAKKIYSCADFPFPFRNEIDFFASKKDLVTTGDQQSILDLERNELLDNLVRKGWLTNFNRRSRYLIDLSGIGIIHAKYLGLSVRSYRKEFIHFRSEYKKFINGRSSKFIS